MDLAKVHADQLTQFLIYLFAEIVDFLLQLIQLCFLSMHLFPTVVNLIELTLRWREYGTPALLEGVEDLLNQGVPLVAKLREFIDSLFWDLADGSPSLLERVRFRL
ncbi:MAG: hypothetical protein ACFFD2_05170 [Promethearchaeota archaeon]